MPQSGPGGPRNGSESTRPAWQQPSRPRYQPPQGPYPQERYPGEQYPQDGYPPEQHHADQYPANQYPTGQYPTEQYPQGPYPGQSQGGFRNPRTGMDYQHGDDYTLAMQQPSGQYTTQLPPDPYAPDPYAPDPYAPDPYARGGYSDEPYVPDAYGFGGPDGQDGPNGGDPLYGAADEPPPGQAGGRAAGRGKRPRKRRIRRFFRRPTVRVICGLLLLFFCWVAFSLGQALTANNGLPLSDKLAEWARDHYLGPVVTMMEQLTYTPPKSGGKPSIAFNDPHSKVKFKHVQGFKPDIPKNLVPFASPPITGEGVWTLQESVKGQPALYTTLMRVDAVHTSYVAGIASFDQRLVKFQLRPGAQDPGAGFGGAQSYIQPGKRTGLLATFNGGFRLNSSQGGFYLNGHTSGMLTSGAASVVYFCNGTIKVGQWGRDVQMTKTICGVRQNLKLIVDRGHVASNINQDVQANFGATIGGAYAVWRSGLGQTKDGRIIYVYGPALSAQSLADLLQRAGAIEGMELDINPSWTSFEYYQARGHATDPTPVPLQPTQPTPADRYYSVWGRDFTAVFAR